ncbi:MAG: CBS domain-containing protein [Ilumatobacteraceae bacterium]
MVPRPDMVVVSDSDRDRCPRHRHRPWVLRLPVLSTGGAGRTSSGWPTPRTLMKAERAGEGAPAHHAVGPLGDLHPRKNKPVAHLILEMREEKFHLAVVIDEYGEIAGIVTLEDCLRGARRGHRRRVRQRGRRYEIVDDGEEYLVGPWGSPRSVSSSGPNFRGRLGHLGRIRVRHHGPHVPGSTRPSMREAGGSAPRSSRSPDPPGPHREVAPVRADGGGRRRRAAAGSDESVDA